MKYLAKIKFSHRGKTYFPGDEVVDADMNMMLSMNRIEEEKPIEPETIEVEDGVELYGESS
jgi:hypothetical protein